MKKKNRRQHEEVGGEHIGGEGTRNGYAEQRELKPLTLYPDCHFRQQMVSGYRYGTGIFMGFRQRNSLLA